MEVRLERYGSVIKIKNNKLNEYKELHSKVWPGVQKTIKDCNIKNYSIYYKDGYLFSYFEYVGKDFKRDMEIMAKDPITKKWWALCGPMQIPLDTRKEGEWWAYMEEVFHQD